jgi:putative Holliday junction resolvase
MALDWGTRRVGVAVTDPLGLLAHPVATLPAEDERLLVAELKKIIEEKDVTRIVVGLPVNMDGSHGPAAAAARAFAERIGAASRLEEAERARRPRRGGPDPGGVARERKALQGLKPRL